MPGVLPIAAVPIFIVIPLQFEHNRSAAKGCARYRNRYRVSDTGILISLIVGPLSISTSASRVDCESRPKGERIPLISDRDIKVCQIMPSLFLPLHFSLSLPLFLALSFSRNLVLSDVRREKMGGQKIKKKKRKRKNNRGDGKSTFSCSLAESSLKRETYLRVFYIPHGSPFIPARSREGGC